MVITATSALFISLLPPPCELRGRLVVCACWDRVKDEVKVRLEARHCRYLLLAWKWRVSRHRLWWQVIVAIWSVEKGLSALAVPREGGVKDQPRGRAGLGVQRAPTWGRAIFHIKAEKESRKLQSHEKHGGEHLIRTMQTNVCARHFTKNFTHCGKF